MSFQGSLIDLGGAVLITMLGGPGCLVATSDGDLRTRRMRQKETPPFAGGVQFAEYHVGASSIRQPAHWFLIPLFPPASRAQRGGFNTATRRPRSVGVI